MPDPNEVSGIVDKVRTRLAEAEREGVRLRVTGQTLDDDWLYVAVEPSEPGVRASDHARLMSRIERQLRAEGDNHVVLVPALEE